MAYIKATGICLLLTFVSCLEAEEVITSPPVTNWGEWGYFETCPNGTAVQGFRLKTEPFRGPLVDDTALNGIRLYCGGPLDPNTKSLTSSLGSWGEWGNTYACGLSGFIVGFQLRVERPGLVQDETATNNVRFLCSNMEEPNNYIEGDGLSFGSWGQAVRCSEGKAICGIQTQIQPDRGAILDDTAMNNLSAQCCPIPTRKE